MKQISLLAGIVATVLIASPSKAEPDANPTLNTMLMLQLVHEVQVASARLELINNQLVEIKRLQQSLEAIKTAPPTP